jgi:hypothetical protein
MDLFEAHLNKLRKKILNGRGLRMTLKLTPEGIQGYTDRIQAAWASNYASGWEMEFLQDMEERFAMGQPVRLSDKQWNRLNIILEKCGA